MFFYDILMGDNRIINKQKMKKIIWAAAALLISFSAKSQVLVRTVQRIPAPARVVVIERPTPPPVVLPTPRVVYHHPRPVPMPAPRVVYHHPRPVPMPQVVYRHHPRPVPPPPHPRPHHRGPAHHPHHR